MTLFGPKTHALQERAQKVIPLGVNSNFRYWGQKKTPYVLGTEENSLRFSRQRCLPMGCGGQAVY